MSVHFLREMEHLNQQLIAVGERVEKQVGSAFDAAAQLDVSAAQRIIIGDDEIDNMEVQLEEDCLKLLALYQPVANDLRLIIAVLKINNDLERIGDHTVQIAKSVISLVEKPPIELPEAMFSIFKLVKLMLRKSLLAFVEADQGLASTVLDMDDKVDTLCADTMPVEIEKIRNDTAQIEQRLILINICRQLERIGDHASNIAEDVIY
ncbi:MAG: phosphate signaling complex protein PhoU, partial [Gammaproteobacteria bacterium]